MIISRKLHPPFFLFSRKIGVNSVETMDVYSFDEEMLSFIPKPQLGMILCFPDFTKVDTFSQKKFKTFMYYNFWMAKFRCSKSKE